MNLQILWFVIIAFLWSGYFLLEGFDFGVGMLLPFLPRDERERGVMLQSIGPVWDGNEVWLVVAGGATFAAFPAWYAAMFSGFYLALLLVLVCLMVRVVSFEWRTKSKSPHWRSVWLAANAFGSYGAAFVWGVALSALLYGVPLASSGDFTGTFWDLFHPFTVLAGLAVVVLFAFHGATFLTLRTRGDLMTRASLAGRRLAIPAVVIGTAFFVYAVVVAVQRNDKSVFPPVLPAALGVGALALALIFAVRRESRLAFTMTALATVLTVVTLFVGLYPRVMVSSPNFANSLTVGNAASAHYTLAVMSIAALIITPVVLVYQAWTYRVFRQRLGGGDPAPDTRHELHAQPGG
jgi:cytochrome d ubiquinol oxidase subunit II